MLLELRKKDDFGIPLYVVGQCFGKGTHTFSGVVPCRQQLKKLAAAAAATVTLKKRHAYVAKVQTKVYTRQREMSRCRRCFDRSSSKYLCTFLWNSILWQFDVTREDDNGDEFKCSRPAPAGPYSYAWMMMHLKMMMQIPGLIYHERHIWPFGRA